MLVPQSGLGHPDPVRGAGRPGPGLRVGAGGGGELLIERQHLGQELPLLRGDGRLGGERVPGRLRHHHVQHGDHFGVGVLLQPLAFHSGKPLPFLLLRLVVRPLLVPYGERPLLFLFFLLSGLTVGPRLFTLSGLLGLNPPLVGPDQPDGGADDAQQQDRGQQPAGPLHHPPPLHLLGGLRLGPRPIGLGPTQPLLHARPVRGHFRGDRSRVRRPVGGVRGEAPLGQGDQIRVRAAAREPGEHVGQVRGGGLGDRLSPRRANERRLAGQDRGQHRPEGEHVGTGIDRFAAGLLRGHVARGAHDRPGHRLEG